MKREIIFEGLLTEAQYDSFQEIIKGINKPTGLKIEVTYLEELSESNTFKHLGYYDPEKTYDDHRMDKKGYKIVASFDKCKGQKVLVRIRFYSNPRENYFYDNLRDLNNLFSQTKG